MKKFSFLWLIAILVFTSCSQDEEFYSCDPDVDQWTKEHLSEIKTMTRSNWLEVEGEDYKKAVYIAFTPDQEILFWKEKLSEVLELDWNSEERNHIKLLINYIEQNPELFDDMNSDKDSFEKFVYLWLERAREELKWDDSIIYAIAVSGERMIDTKGTLGTINSRSLTPTSKTKSDCTCNGGINVCGPGNITAFYVCEQPDGGCEIIPKSCGFLFQSECNGDCVLYPKSKSL